MRQVQKITASGRLLINSDNRRWSRIYTQEMSVRECLCVISGRPPLLTRELLVSLVRRGWLGLRLLFVSGITSLLSVLCSVQWRLESFYVVGHKKQRAAPSHPSQNSSLRNILLFPTWSPEINNHPSKHGFGVHSMETIPVPGKKELAEELYSWNVALAQQNRMTYVVKNNNNNILISFHLLYSLSHLILTSTSWRILELYGMRSSGKFPLYLKNSSLAIWIPMHASKYSKYKITRKLIQEKAAI